MVKLSSLFLFNQHVNCLRRSSDVFFCPLCDKVSWMLALQSWAPLCFQFHGVLSFSCPWLLEQLGVPCWQLNSPGHNWWLSWLMQHGVWLTAHASMSMYCSASPTLALDPLSRSSYPNSHLKYMLKFDLLQYICKCIICIFATSECITCTCYVEVRSYTVYSPNLLYAYLQHLNVYVY